MLDLKHLVLAIEQGTVAYFNGTSKALVENSLCFDCSLTISLSITDKNCCDLQTGHLHAHVHRGDAVEEILLAQCTGGESCCVLPDDHPEGDVDVADPSPRLDHKHGSRCGHHQVAHGDHLDWMEPQTDNSFLLVHERNLRAFGHGRLVKIGESTGKLEGLRPSQPLEVFRYQASPPLPDATPGEVTLEVMRSRVTVTRLTVLGICCAGEVPVIKRIVEPLPGVEDVSVNFLTRTVTVVHDPEVTSDRALESALNDARMEASIQHKGQKRTSTRKLQLGLLCVSGAFLAASLFHLLFSPLKYLSLGAVLVSVPGIALKAMSSLRRLNLDINVLMLIAVVGAVCLENYIEAGTIVFLFSFADWLQQNAVKKASDAIGAAADLVPQTATLATSGHSVPLENVEVGSLISIRAEEMVPLDGIVSSGITSVNESSLTGESRPVNKRVGDRVWAGTINLSGLIIVETTSTAENSALSRMIKLVEEAQGKRSRTELYVETFAKYYTPAVVLGALAIALIPFFLHANDERHWIYLSLVIVVVACPCALVISTPVTATCAIARAARSGLVIKGGDCLEVLAKLNVMAMDKTGTLTQGQFQVLDFMLIDSSTSLTQLLEWISGVENLSIHPIATAFVDYARRRNSQPCSDVVDFKAVQGEGVSGIAEGHLVEIGNSRLATRRGWNIPGGESNAVKSFVGVDGKLVGFFTAADQLRPESRTAIQDLKDLDVKILMLTGDSHQTATDIGHQLDGIEFHAELLPEDKLKILEQLKASSKVTVAMVGDGVNDAPSLAAADVGIAMGVAGSAIALETADIALMTNDLCKLATAVRIGREYRRVVMQNIFLSLATKLLVVVLAAAGYAPLWVAVLADVGTCMLVTLNGTRILLLGEQNRTSLQSESSSMEQKPKSKCCSGCYDSQDIRTPLLG